MTPNNALYEANLGSRSKSTSRPRVSSQGVRRVFWVPLDHPSTLDPDGRVVVFDMGTRLHLALSRPELLDAVELILGIIAHPDHRSDDPISGREHFYRRGLDSRR